MSGSSKKGPIVDAGQCRCCGATKRCRLLNIEYEWFGQKEIYSDMFMDCFGLLLSHLDGETEERLICATCVTRLREASSFRRQVLECEEKLLNKIHGENDGTNASNLVKEETDVINESNTSNAMLDDLMDSSDHSGKDPGDVTLICKSTKRLRRKKIKIHKKKESANIDTILPSDVIDEDLSNNYKDFEDIDSSHKPTGLKSTNENSKANLNIVTLVENSYVCPFDTSFSDYYCIYCRQVFTDPNKLREHSLCHDPSMFKDIISNYNKKVQIDIYRIDCRLCTAQIRELEEFKNHISSVHEKLIHTVEDRFLKFRLTPDRLSCTECSVSFTFFHALKKHMAEHFGTCICDVCGAHYFEERMLLLHQKTHQGIEEHFSCKECGKTFKSKYTRYIHVARTHKKEAAYQCSKCDEVFFSYTLRYRHMIEIHGEERMFQCEHCDRAYDSRKSLREHNRRYHLKILKHQCDLCDKRFYLPSRLKEHMASHTGERNFRCEFCGKSYQRMRGLKVHMQSHSAEKKFKCMMCNASFTQNVNLKNHVKRQHQGLEIDDYRE